MNTPIETSTHVGGSLARLVSTTGHDALWLWFGLSRASWLTLPRVLLHEMPDEWQSKMAALLNEMDKTFPNYPDIQHSVTTKAGGKYIKTPDALCNYRYPDDDAINAMRANDKLSHGHPTTKKDTI